MHVHAYINTDIQNMYMNVWSHNFQECLYGNITDIAQESSYIFQEVTDMAQELLCVMYNNSWRSKVAYSVMCIHDSLMSLLDTGYKISTSLVDNMEYKHVFTHYSLHKMSKTLYLITFWHRCLKLLRKFFSCWESSSTMKSLHW